MKFHYLKRRDLTNINYLLIEKFGVGDFETKTIANMDVQAVKNWNIFVLSLAFMLVFTGFGTLGYIQNVILDSAKNKASDGYVDGFNGDG